jgi:NitT/TauT family transport system ATP-binding protein
MPLPEPASNIDLALDGVSKTFAGANGPVEALRDISLGARRGELISILGPSGCGKTTILRMIAGLEQPTAGSIEIHGQRIEPGRKRGRDGAPSFAVVFQEPRLLPWFNVEDNVALPLRLEGVDAAARRARARELLALVGLAGFERAAPEQLSGGMKQRAAIARALILEPRLLLLDEPFGALDAMTRDQMNLELQRIRSTISSTVLLITHSLSEAVFLGDRVLAMTPRPGRIAASYDVPFPGPRDLDLQSTPEFQALVRDLRRLMTGWHA